MITTFRIHPEIESYIRKQSEEENRLLEESLLAEGARDPLVVWEEQNVLVDGHHRIAICRKHGLSYSVVYRSFPDIGAVKRWMRLNQLSRRNLDKEERERWIKELHAEGWTQAEIGEAVGITQQGVAKTLKRLDTTSCNEPTIKSTSAAEELEAKQREIERLRAEKEALAERERKESQARMKAEGERLSLQNQLDGMVEMVKKEQSKKVEYITPPDVEDELESLRLENSRIAAALEEAKRAQSPVALPEPKVERVEVEVIKEVVPEEVKAKLREQEEQIRQMNMRGLDEQRANERKMSLELEIEKLRMERSRSRVETTFDGVITMIMDQKALAKNIVDLAKNGDLTIQQMDEAQNLMNNVICAANDILNDLREIRGDFKKGGGLRAL